MTSLTINSVCKEHTPHMSAISIVEDMRYTFCEDCEQNIESWYDDTDYERLPMWRDWKVSN
jgi:hypothetical protein